MFKFAIKNMLTKKVQILLVAFSIIISASVAILSFNVAEQVNDGISGTAGYYSAIIGPAGSATQLAMNTMYFSDEPLGTFPISVASEIGRDTRVTEVIPFAMADSYNGFNVVGASPTFLSTKEFAEGELFAENSSFEVVVGAKVAKVCSLKVGDEIFTSHSAGEEHTVPFIVKGILKETYTAYDNQVFTTVKTIWDVHETEEHEEHEEHDHEEMNGMICAVLVRTKNPSYAMQLVADYDGKIIGDEDGDNFTLQAIEPMATVRNVLQDTNNTKYIVFTLCAVILIMNIAVIAVITLLNMYHSKKEINLMRLIGISAKRINHVYLIENIITGGISVVFAFAVSRLCMLFISDFVTDYGVVLNIAKVYSFEFVILAAVFLINIIPTVLCVRRTANGK